MPDMSRKDSERSGGNQRRKGLREEEGECHSG